MSFILYYLYVGETAGIGYYKDWIAFARVLELFRILGTAPT